MDYIKKWTTYWYFRYELVTNLYVFEPWEKNFLNALILGTAGMVLFSSWMYLPSYIKSTIASLQNSCDTVRGLDQSSL